MTRLEQARTQIAAARMYTLRLLDAVPDEDWYRLPQPGVTYVAWQAGHLVLAQYRLALLRLRGRRAEDEQLVSDAFLARYAGGSVPVPDPTLDPSPAELRSILDRVHAQAMQETATLPESEWDQPLLIPHDIARTKVEALNWCAMHEFVHAGQIGLLRRLFGQAPLW